MFTAKAPTGPGFSMPDRRCGSHRGLVYLLLTTLAVISVAACQRAPEVTEQWAPPYLEMHLFAGKVQVQGAEGSEWTTMEGKAGFTLEERGQIIADEVEGAQLFLGDGSTLELDPGTILELRNPRTLPRLQVIVQKGGLLFFAQKPSFEFIVSARPVTLLSVPSLIRIEVHGETTRLSVEEGAATYQGETETLMLPTCREMSIELGTEPDVTEFCTPSTMVPPSTPTPTPPGFEPTVTPSASATPTPELTPTPEDTVSPPTPTPLPPTNTPVPPTKPKATKPPPTNPPPTNPPPTQPPPTEPRPTAPPSTQPRPTAAPALSS
jgi:hypothetical protein